MFKRSKILSGIKILDVSRIFTRPFCSQILHDLGAEIIKIEPPGGDDTKKWGPPFIGDISSYYLSLNRGKTSIQLNLKDEEDYSQFVKLVQECDVFIENYRVGVVKKLKIDYHLLRKINPGLIYLSITGFGSVGPYKNHSSYDIIAQSESGLMSITGTRDGELTKVGVPIGDISGGMYGAIGIISALYEREKTGMGKKIETNLFAGLNSFLTYQGMNSLYQEMHPLGTAHPNIVPYESFKCKDNKWISIAVANDKLWTDFCDTMIEFISLDIEEFSTNKLRVENRNKLISLLFDVFSHESRDFWYELLQSKGIPVGRVNSIQEVYQHPQVQFSGQKQFIRHADTDIPVFITPLRFEL